MKRSSRAVPDSLADDEKDSASEGSGSRSSFYYSFLLLPASQRDAILDVYAFMRAVDDAVDEEDAPPLETWADELERVYAGSEPLTEVGARLRRAVQAHEIPKRHFDALLRGCAFDRDGRRYESHEDLADYCWHVAGTVGRACLPIFGVPEEAAGIYADRLGEALQMTNILRDVGEDAQRGRIYLPQEDLDRFEVSRDALRGAVEDEKIRALFAYQGARAASLFRAADEALPIDRNLRRRLIAPRVMGAVYRALLEKMRRAGYPSLTQRMRLSRPRLAWIAGRVWLRAKLSS